MGDVDLPRIGSYEPLLELAAGGMGIVYVARKLGDAGFERLVVLKRVHRRLLQDPKFHDMLRDEARVASLLRHPHVVPVIDVVETDGELSLVFDYVESFSLAEVMALAGAAHEKIPLPIAARIMHDALAGLHAAHEAVDLEGKPLHLIHRDVSPQNVIVGVDGTSRIIDFGIAKATARLSQTGHGVVKGKLRYMSPEQAKQGTVDRRSDIFSAGVVLYEAITGQRLFAAEDVGDIFLAILLGDLRPPSEIEPAIPPELDRVVLRALSVERESRFATAVDFEEALEHAVPLAPAREVARYVERLGGDRLEARRTKLRSFGRASVPASQTVASEAQVTQVTQVASDAPGAGPGRTRRTWMLAGVAACVLVVAIAAAKARSASPQPAPAPSWVEAPPAPPPPPESSAVFVPRIESSNAPPSPEPRTAPRRKLRHHAAASDPDLHRNPYENR